jgi:hypothetical protein
MNIIRAVRHSLATIVEPSRYLLDGYDVRRLMRRHQVTISDLAMRTGITQKRIRAVRETGLNDPHAVRDWLQAITGNDPGQITSARIPELTRAGCVQRTNTGEV